MKVAIIGYGKMGKTIEGLLLERGHEIVARFDREGLNERQLREAEVAIEFSRPEAAFTNISTCLKNQIPVVIGTTGWLQHYEEAAILCSSHRGAMLYASNFSLGVNIFFEINRRLAQLMNSHDNYQVSIEEIHHTEKKDAPSGTAISLAEQIQDKLDRKKGWTMEDAHAPDQIHIEALRKEDVKGTHTVRYDSDIDTLEIKHTAHTRKGFALGAVLAAEFLHTRNGVFTMQDLLKIL